MIVDSYKPTKVLKNIVKINYCEYNVLILSRNVLFL